MKVGTSDLKALEASAFTFPYVMTIWCREPPYRLVISASISPEAAWAEAMQCETLCPAIFHRDKTGRWRQLRRPKPPRPTPPKETIERSKRLIAELDVSGTRGEPAKDQ